jgi:2,6-dihydroxypseudooxynicotine hydrolase
MATETADRVRLAASHWKPRFVANGIDANDFERVLSETTEWRDWAPHWQRVGDQHRAIAEDAQRSGRLVTATDAFQRAAWSYHLGKFLWFEDAALHDLLRQLTVDTYANALRGLSPAGARVEAPFEGSVIPGILRRPDGEAAPLVILVPGLDSVKEELFAIENEFLRRGMATLSIDGPGQGESAPRFAIRADWSTVITPLLDHLASRDHGVRLDRVGLVGVSMGGIYGPRAAAKEKRLRALVALAGPFDLSECWAQLNPLTRAGYVFYTKSRDEAEAFERSKTLTLRGVLLDVSCPLLVVHGGKDRLFPPEQAERIVREAPNGTLLLYPEGNHVCNNIPYKYRPAMADWMRERLG